MAGAILGIFGVLLILMTGEILWRFKLLRGEPSRALIHLLAGSFVAFWPFFMSMRYVQVIAGLALVAIGVSRRYHLFQSVHAVRRRTYGEFFFPLAVGLCATITGSDLIFMAAILHLSLADGLASLVGSHFGGKTKYQILGQHKSLAGNAAFYLASLAIMTYVGIFHVELFLHANVWFIALVPVVATLAESLSVYGTDDLIVSLVVVTMLQLLHVAH